MLLSILVNGFGVATPHPQAECLSLLLCILLLTVLMVLCT